MCLLSYSWLAHKMEQLFRSHYPGTPSVQYLMEANLTNPETHSPSLWKGNVVLAWTISLRKHHHVENSAVCVYLRQREREGRRREKLNSHYIPMVCLYVNANYFLILILHILISWKFDKTIDRRRFKCKRDIFNNGNTTFYFANILFHLNIYTIFNILCIISFFF